MGNKCIVIAEAGVNHNGQLDLAIELIDVAYQAGADVVKFQTFDSDLLVSANAAKAEYQKKQTGEGSQLEMLKKLELSKTDFIKLFEYAAKIGIKCISTPFDVRSLDFLVDLGMGIIKVPSGEVTNGPFLLEIGRKKLPTILSTGMCTLEDIERALSVLAYGYANPVSKPSSIKQCIDLWKAGPEEYQAFKSSITVLHCTTNYPADLAEINLNAMITMREKFGLPIGYSDHSLGIIVPIVAASMGAVVIEKHITLDKTMEGPDHAASLEPAELRDMVSSIRNVEIIQGAYEKAPSASERQNAQVARRGLYASKDIAVGELLSESNVTALRPMTNKSPMDVWDVLGTKSIVKYSSGDAI